MPNERLRGLIEDLAEDYTEDYRNDRILSFDEYLGVFEEYPKAQSRNAVQYVRDAIDHFGTAEGTRPWGDYVRYRIFDGIGTDARKVAGMEAVQKDFYDALDVQARQGRTDKIVILHGPSGSGKTTFFETLLAGLEAYSDTDSGAIYRFHWIFPSTAADEDRGIGFGSTKSVGEVDSYAHLKPDDIEARIPGEMADHPLLLLPPELRERIVKRAWPEEVPLPENFLQGDLNPTNREILDALLLAHNGDLRMALKHVQVERFNISRRYRRSAVFVEPQLHVDASLQQVTLDQSYKALPSDLRHLDLHRPKGHLVEGNRGMVVFEDLFKRPPEMNRYLLGTAEKGRVTVDNKILQLDSLLTGTANEIHLNHWRQSVDYVSMRGRIELIRVPYLLDYNLEQDMYEEFLSEVSLSIHIAPHTVRTAAYWTVLTRMHPFSDIELPDRVDEVLCEMTPGEKAELYARGKPPSWVPSELGQELRSLIPDLMRESLINDTPEGMVGLSSRRMKMIFLAAARAEDKCLSPLRMIEFIEDILNDSDLCPDFKVDSIRDFHQPLLLLDRTKDRYIAWLETEMLTALDFVEESSFDDLFARYVYQVQHYLSGEKVYNRVTDAYQEPDENLMEEVEQMLDVREDADQFRQTVLNTIAAYSLDNPDEDVEYRLVFPSYSETFRQSVLKREREPILNSYRNVLKMLSDEEKSLSPKEKRDSEATVDKLKETHKFCDECVREAVGLLVRKWEEELE